MALYLERIANIEYTYSVNQISHENTQRKIFVSCNVQGRDLGSTVEEIKQTIHDQMSNFQQELISFMEVNLRLRNVHRRK